MTRKIYTFLFLFFIVALSGCLKDDLNDLQDQIDDLNQKVGDLEETQQNQLLQAIQQLQTALQELESNTDARYTALLENLQLIEDEVANNATAVYYGNLLTDEDYAKFTEQGATIVTGKVTATTADHFEALASLKLVGDDMIITSDMSINLQNLENVGNDLLITGVAGDAVIQLPALGSVGGNLEVTMNPAMVEFVADELVLVNGALQVSKNDKLLAVSFAKLDMADELYINEYFEADPEYIFVGKLSSINLSGVDVKNDVHISYIAGGTAEIGSVGGEFNVTYTGLTTISILSEKIGGNFTLQYNSVLNEFVADNLKEIEGNVDISFNDNGYLWTQETRTGMVNMPSFSALETIMGDVTIVGNNELKSLEAFNNVTLVRGSKIEIGSNGTDVENILVFDALTTAGANQFASIDININANTNWFDGFGSLAKAKYIYLNIKRPSEGFGGGIGIGVSTVTDVARVDGFDSMTEISSMFMDLSEVTEFNAFPVLDNFQNFQTYLEVWMPSDTNVGMCSMANILNKIKDGAFDVSWNENRKAVFRYNYMEMDRDSAVDQLLSTCNP